MTDNAKTNIIGNILIIVMLAGFVGVGKILETPIVPERYNLMVYIFICFFAIDAIWTGLSGK